MSATDALATLGTIIDDTAKRDAIHLAVIPAIAAETQTLFPGHHVVVRGERAYRVASGEGVGIVDPFLTSRVEPGQRFWLILYPRTIQSLRHVWSHPAFLDEVPEMTRAASERWLQNFAEETPNCPEYEVVIATVKNELQRGIREHSIPLGRIGGGDLPTEFWDHIEIVLGVKIDVRPMSFHCQC